MATISAATAANLLVSLMAVAPKPETGRATTSARAARGPGPTQRDSARRDASATQLQADNA